MVGHYLRKRLRGARLARRLAGFSALLLVVAVVVFRYRGIDYAAFVAVLGLVAALAGAALVLALAGLARVWRSGHEGGGASAVALLFALFVAVPFAAVAALAVRNPPVNLAETAGMADNGAMDAESGGARAVDPTAVAVPLGGRVFGARASQVYQGVRAALNETGWTVSDVETANELASVDPPANADGTPADAVLPIPTPRDEAARIPESLPDPLDRPEAGEYRIEAIAESPVLRLPSDVEIRITEDETRAYLDLRAQSRFGRLDFGQNRRFVEDFLSQVDAAMVGVGTSVVGDGS